MPLIQAQVAKRGLRIAEFFHDFDRLRTGTVTKAQFTRCVAGSKDAQGTFVRGQPALSQLRTYTDC